MELLQFWLRFDRALGALAELPGNLCRAISIGSAVVTSLAASRSTSCYFSPRANLDVLRRMARTLKPGGRILIDHRDRNRDARLPRAVVGPCALRNAGTSGDEVRSVRRALVG